MKIFKKRALKSLE